METTSKTSFNDFHTEIARHLQTIEDLNNQLRNLSKQHEDVLQKNAMLTAKIADAETYWRKENEKVMVFEVEIAHVRTVLQEAGFFYREAPSLAHEVALALLNIARPGREG